MERTQHFVKIDARLMRLLARLIEQKKADLFGGIGWRGLLEENEERPMDCLFLPLLKRGLIEDLTALPDFGPRAGQYFVRITPVGEKCHETGWMPIAEHKTTLREIDKFATELTPQDEVIPAGATS